MANSRNPEPEPEAPRVEGDELIPPDPQPQQPERKKLPSTKWY